jgi:hypothetical protein
MSDYIITLVGNYVAPERPPFVPSAQTIYEKEDFIKHCTGLSSPSDICVIGLYDGSRATAKVSTDFEHFEKASQ